MHKILIVDDNSTMRQILKLYMMGKMHTFLEADSAQRAFEILEQESVDLLIVDIHLGRIDGVEFVRMLREKDASARDVPVVFISGDRDGSQAVTGLNTARARSCSSPWIARSWSRSLTRCCRGRPGESRAVRGEGAAPAEPRRSRRSGPSAGSARRRQRGHRRL
ncbi:MAG: response regulator [Myxococcales bacterium]|nr:response regulator [Myxococcales bacterium]